MILGALTTITLVIIGEQLGTDDGAVVFVWAIDPVLVGIPVTVLTLVIGTFIETRGWKDTEKVAVINIKKANLFGQSLLYLISISFQYFLFQGVICALYSSYHIYFNKMLINMSLCILDYATFSLLSMHIA